MHDIAYCYFVICRSLIGALLLALFEDAALEVC